MEIEPITLVNVAVFIIFGVIRVIVHLRSEGKKLRELGFVADPERYGHTECLGRPGWASNVYTRHSDDMRITLFKDRTFDKERPRAVLSFPDPGLTIPDAVFLNDNAATQGLKRALGVRASNDTPEELRHITVRSEDQKALAQSLSPVAIRYLANMPREVLGISIAHGRVEIMLRYEHTLDVLNNMDLYEHALGALMGV